jgi:glycosyltransferase involved in cell wall biosynthesis
MFKVLIIAYYFPPMGLSGVQRTLKFAKYMRKFNWEPTVLTCGNTGYFAHDKSLMKEVEDADIEVIRTEATDPNSLLASFGTIKMPGESVRKAFSKANKALFIPDNKKFWSKKALKTGQDILSQRDFDILFVTVPPFSSFLTAVTLKKQFDLPLFVDYRDLWVQNQFAYYPTYYHKYKHKQMENASLKSADRVIVPNRVIKEKILNDYPFLNHDEVIILQHGYDKADFENLAPIEYEKKKMRLLYAGIFYENITPYYFLQAFKQITIERPDVAENIELQFVGLLRDENRKLIKKLKLESYVRDFEYLDHKEAIRKMISADVLWMTVGKIPNAETISTGKLFEYFGTKKPVIAFVPDGAAKLNAQEYGAAFIEEPDNIEGIKNTILKVHRLYKSESLPQPNDEFVEKLNREKLTEQLTKHFQFFLKEEI